MKVEQEKKFYPITIGIENPEEARILHDFVDNYYTEYGRETIERSFLIKLANALCECEF